MHWPTGSRRSGGSPPRAGAIVAVAAEDGIRLGTGTLWLLRIALDDGSRARYAVPLREGAALADALDDPTFCRALLGLIATGGRAPGASGELRGTPTSGFPADLAAGAAPRRLGVEQSNTSVVFGERLILKHFRRLQVGPNPEIEITQFLTERTTFRHTPRLCGSLAYHDAEGEWSVAITQELVTDARDGWRFLLDRLAAGDGALGGTRGAGPDHRRATRRAGLRPRGDVRDGARAHHGCRRDGVDGGRPAPDRAGRRTPWADVSRTARRRGSTPPVSAGSSAS